MNPLVGRWLLQHSGREVGPPTKQHTLSLDTMMPLLAPKHVHLFADRHDAGADAQMTRLIYIALLRHLKPQSALDASGRSMGDAGQPTKKARGPEHAEPAEAAQPATTPPS